MANIFEIQTFFWQHRVSIVIDLTAAMVLSCGKAGKPLHFEAYKLDTGTGCVYLGGLSSIEKHGTGGILYICITTCAQTSIATSSGKSCSSYLTTYSI